MTTRSILALAGLAGFILSAAAGSAATPLTQATGVTPTAQQTPERAIRRDIPLSDMIRRAFAAGTRDSTGRPGRNYWQLRVDYTIRARLDPSTSTLSGSETAVIHNTSDSPLTYIALRLDQNIFRADAQRGASVPAEITDGMVITRMAIDGQPVDLTRQARGGPGGGGGGRAQGAPSASGLTQTSARVNLARPIPAAASAELEVEWRFKLAGGTGGSGHRMTARWGDTLYQVTQWYPRVAVFDDLRGWDTDPYLGPSEFYNNFGRFDVRLDVPAGWIVGATGVLQNPEEVLTPTTRERLSRVLESDAVRTIVGRDEVGPGSATAAGDRLVWHFVADTVNDFAWGTAKQFVWTATRATIPGTPAQRTSRGVEVPGVPARRVPIHMLYLPGRAQLYEDVGPIARHAIEFYSRLWMPYAFPQLTLLDGPDTGMEYPMVLMSNEGAADHEAAHSWWPMTVSNNETRYGWMDEGFNQYMNLLSDADWEKEAPRLDGLGQRYGETSGTELEPPLIWNANYAGPFYSFQTYTKTPLMLSMLGGVVGDSAVWRALSEYAKAWRFKHPSPWDYAFLMNDVLGQDLGWFWYYWLFTTESADGSIQSVTTDGGRATVTVRQDGQMPSPVVLRVQLAPAGPPIRPMSNSKIVDGRTVDATYPVDVWFSGSRTFEAVLDFGGRRIEKITLDPGGRCPDRDVADNVWVP